MESGNSDQVEKLPSNTNDTKAVDPPSQKRLATSLRGCGATAATTRRGDADAELLEFPRRLGD